MGRRFTRSASDYIKADTAQLAGFDFTFGTLAIVLWRVADSADFESLVYTTSPGGGIGATVDDVDRWNLWSGTPAFANTHMTTTLTTGKHWLVVVTKATGTVTARGHVSDFKSAMTHTNASGTCANFAAATSLTIGSYDAGVGNDPGDFEMWAMGFWKNQVMSDGECNRLVRGNWLSTSPTFYEECSHGREVGDMTRTLGRHPVRQTSRSGTTRGVQAPPPGFRMSAQRRRR